MVDVFCNGLFEALTDVELEKIGQFVEDLGKMFLQN